MDHYFRSEVFGPWYYVDILTPCFSTWQAEWQFIFLPNEWSFSLRKSKVRINFKKVGYNFLKFRLKLFRTVMHRLGRIRLLGLCHVIQKSLILDPLLPLPHVILFLRLKLFFQWVVILLKTPFPPIVWRSMRMLHYIFMWILFWKYT